MTVNCCTQLHGIQTALLTMTTSTFSTSVNYRTLQASTLNHLLGFPTFFGCQLCQLHCDGSLITSSVFRERNRCKSAVVVQFNTFRQILLLRSFVVWIASICRTVPFFAFVYIDGYFSFLSSGCIEQFVFFVCSTYL